MTCRGACNWTATARREGFQTCRTKQLCAQQCIQSWRLNSPNLNTQFPPTSSSRPPPPIPLARVQRDRNHRGGRIRGGSGSYGGSVVRVWDGSIGGVPLRPRCFLSTWLRREKCKRVKIWRAGLKTIEYQQDEGKPSFSMYPSLDSSFPLSLVMTTAGQVSVCVCVG